MGEYVAKLRNFPQDCDYGNSFTLMLIERLVCGINAGRTFQKALNFLQIMEATRTGLRSLLLLRLEKHSKIFSRT